MTSIFLIKYAGNFPLKDDQLLSNLKLKMEKSQSKFLKIENENQNAFWFDDKTNKFIKDNKLSKMKVFGQNLFDNINPI